MTGDDIGRVIRRMTHEILETGRRLDDLVLVGIHTRGVPLAQRLADGLATVTGDEVVVGELDIGLYRDDRAFRNDITPRHTRIPVDLSTRHVIVVDDVLYTGRTVRAALDALTDIGRSMSTELAVLIDRGHRELPIRADFVGKNIPTARDEMVRVRLAEVDREEGVFVERMVPA